jgi:hypothetical protein
MSNFSSFENLFQKNNSLKELCEKNQTFSNLNEFYVCYKYFAQKELSKTIFGLTLSSLAVTLNLILLISLIFGSRNKICFDRILVGYCLVDGITGVFELILY